MNSIFSQLTLNALAGGMLVFAFFAPARMRLRSLLLTYAGQSLLLALFAGAVAVMRNEPQLLITAALTVFLKVWFIPWLLARANERSRAIHRLSSYLRPATTLLAAAFMVIGGFLLTPSLVRPTDPNYLIVVTSVSLVLLGLLMLVIRTGLYGQIIGFLLMENGIFLFGLTLTGGMPLLVEIGIFFDVAVGAVIMAALAYRVQREQKTLTTESLTELVD